MPTHEQWQKLASETSKWKARPRYWLLDFITHWSPIADTSSHHSLFLFRGLNDTSGTELERLTQNYFLELVAMATRREPRQWLLWQLPGHPISVSWHYSSSGPLNQIFWAASLEGLCTDVFLLHRYMKELCPLVRQWLKQVLRQRAFDSLNPCQNDKKTAEGFRRSSQLSWILFVFLPRGKSECFVTYRGISRGFRKVVEHLTSWSNNGWCKSKPWDAPFQNVACWMSADTLEADIVSRLDRRNGGNGLIFFLPFVPSAFLKKTFIKRQKSKHESWNTHASGKVNMKSSMMQTHQEC